MTNLPQIWYSASNYPSHARVAESYKRLLRKFLVITDDPDEARIAIIHHEPRELCRIFETHKRLERLYTIGYCVWETDQLPVEYERPITLLDEVWTCSQYCAEVFTRYHKRVIYIPHVIERDVTITQSTISFAKSLISHDRGLTYYLTIARGWDLRKNLTTLLSAFARIYSLAPNLRLVVKCSPTDSVPAMRPPNVLFIPSRLTDLEINALYYLADFYISAHHSEGWGLTLSDAMLFRRPVMATNFSGNLEFMSEINSFLLPAVPRHIAQQDCYGYFRTNMKWAYVEVDDIIDTILRIESATNRQDLIATRVDQANRSIEVFSGDVVSLKLRHNLERIVSSTL